MAKSIYQKQLDEILTKLSTDAGAEGELTVAGETSKPTLLLHACCGPCSSYVLEYLTKYFDITILYYNPNIYPAEEYERRLAELEGFLPRFAPAVEAKVKLVKDDYEPAEFYAAVGTEKEPELAKEAEKGERCRRCYEFRLKRAYAYASAHNFDYFCTTLSISPFKDAQKINVIGGELEKGSCGAEGGTDIDAGTGTGTGGGTGVRKPKWLPSDFKKKSGFLRSLELSEEYGLYRQQYCGCVYSKNNMVK